jgi:hypothetical protein
MFITKNSHNFESRFYCSAEGDAGGGAGGAAAAPAGGAPANQGAAAGTAGIPWLANASTEEIAFAQSKGWDKETTAPADQIFKSYHNLQKLFGADKAGNTVILPGENADQATLDQFYNRVGRPEKVEGYKTEAFNGLNETQDKSLRELAHKVGLTDKQLGALKEWNDGVATQVQQELNSAAQVEFVKQEAALKQEWGAAFDKKLGDAKIATAKLGLNADQIGAMQAALGYDGVMKLIAQIGEGLGEGKFVTNDTGRGGSQTKNIMTPEQAKTELNRLTTDKEFNEAWLNAQHPRHKEMVEKKSQLTRWSNGQQ